ncbi:MAG: succinylglutamate desuccinylase/aspartoacylase family protein [Saprospiraceae bacterium]
MPTPLAARLIGTFGGQTPGPLFIVIAALHGNEPAGVRALELVFEQLEKERRDNPGFSFRGKLVGLIGNLQAFQTGQRFVERDLNRVWTEDFLKRSKASPKEDLAAESREARELFEAVSAECQSCDSEKIVFLDLHTTSAEGGIFSIPIDEGESLALAKHLGVPAIVGLQQSISGTLLGYAAEGRFFSEFGVRNSEFGILCVAFEAGQHESPHATTRSALAIVRCLRALHCIEQEGMAGFMGKLSLPFFGAVSPVVRLCYAHHIGLEDGFRMRPGYANFQPIRQGEHLADDVRGPVLSPEKGLILMPLYQAKGSDGFFIVQ